MSKGKFITFEGIDGSGKSTIIKEIKKIIVAHGIKVTLSREPGGTPIAEEIRSTLLNDKLSNSCSETEALMMFAARFENLKENIIPALNENKWVLCDRFTDSTFAYQVYGKGLAMNFVEQLAQLVHPKHSPDVTFVLDVDTETSLQRLSQKTEESNHFDSHANHFQDRVRQGYLDLAKKHPQRIQVIDASQSINQVVNDIQKHLQKWMME